jgi:CRP-like cAMP-binding protein
MKSYMQKFNILSPADADKLDGLTSTRTLAKGDFFIQEGKVCEEVVYIKSGILRSFYYSDKEEEITYCLTFAGNLMTALSSLITGQPTVESIQALTQVELIAIKKRDLEALFNSENAWLKLGKYLTELQYVELEKRIFGYQKHSAKKRYEELLVKQPGHVQQIPLQYLASFLNVSVRHLSRLRKEISS